MKAKEFIEEWEKLMGTHLQKGDTLRTQWKDDAKWTMDVIGEAHSESEGSLLGNALKRRLNEKETVEPKLEWHYRTEEWKLDLVLARKENWCFLKNAMEPDKEGKLPFWPTTYEIIVEHETSGGLSWQEMVKLIHLRSRLKVLITYTYDIRNSEESQKKSQDLIDETRMQFHAMLKAAWKNFPENWDTEYLLIVGQLDSDVPEVKWHYSVFAPWGEILLPKRKSEIR